MEKNILLNEAQIQKVKTVMLSMQRYSWEQGLAAQACFEIGDSAAGILLAREAVHRQAKDGRLAQMDAEDSLDPGANGIPVLLAYQLTGEACFQEAARRMADWFLHQAPRSAEGVLYMTLHGKWTVLDGIYHTAPFLALAGYPDEAVRQVRGFRKIHYHPEKNLYLQTWDDEKKIFSRPIAWGGAHGWLACALALVLDTLPEQMWSEKRELAGYFQELIDGVLAYQRADGLFQNVLDDPSSFVETTTALMLCTAMYRAVQSGWLAKTYLTAVDRMRNAAYARVDETGFVQGACGAPTFESIGQSTEAQAFLLLAEAASRRLEASL